MTTFEESNLWKYREACRQGEHIIGAELEMLLDSLIDGIQSGRYIYDTTAFDKRVYPALKNCCRGNKAPFYGKMLDWQLWERAFFECIYSYKMPDGVSNRFKKVLLLISRKNGKSAIASALTLAELLTGAEGSEIAVGSNNDADAKLVFDAVDVQRQIIDPQQKVLRRGVSGLRFPKRGSICFRMSAKAMNLDGRNTDIGIVDEVWAAPDNTLVKALELSQSLKKNPLILMITTEGFLDGGYLDSELEYARGVLTGEIVDAASERYLPWLYTQDSESEIWQGDRENRLWEKSNPMLGITKSWEHLEEQVASARRSAAERAKILPKEFNFKLYGNGDNWLTKEEIDRNDQAVDLSQFSGSVCLGAVDLAETTDTTSAGILMLKDGDSHKHAVMHYWIPSNKLEKAADTASGARYEEWARQGLLSVCEGNFVDVTAVADWFYSLYEAYGLRPVACGYDQRFAREFLDKMEYYGIDTEMINQTNAVLSPAINMLESELKDGRVAGLDDVTRWMLGNAGVKADAKGLLQIVKSGRKRSNRIDGVDVLTMLYEMLRRHGAEIRGD